jgi:hypothetical protein
VLEYRRPLWRTVKEYPMAEVADVRAVGSGERSYSLALILRSGQRVRLDLGGSSDLAGWERKAAEIKSKLGLPL